MSSKVTWEQIVLDVVWLLLTRLLRQGQTEAPITAEEYPVPREPLPESAAPPMTASPVLTPSPVALLLNCATALRLAAEGGGKTAKEILAPLLQEAGDRHV